MLPVSAEVRPLLSSPIEGRYGWYLCDWATYRKLKRLNAAYWDACRKLSSYYRWIAKLNPENRVIRKRLYSEDGRPAGSAVVGPRPEPARSTVFSHAPDRECRRMTIPEHIVDYGIRYMYQLARHPQAFEQVARESKVIDLELIERLHALLPPDAPRRARGPRATPAP